jgi:hypothetical protein
VNELRSLIARIVKTRGSVLELLLICIEIINHYRLNKVLIDFYFVMIKNSNTKTETIYRFLNLERATFERPFRMSYLSWVILGRYENGRGLKDPKDTERFLLSVAYSQDDNLIEKILEMSADLCLRPGLPELLKACLEFRRNDSSWIITMNASKMKVTSLDRNEIRDSEFLKYTKNFHSQDMYFNLFDQIKLSEVDEDKEKFAHETTCLVSCDLKYFIIFSEFFCKHFRIKNDHPLIFIVVLENDSNLVEFAKACNRLTKFAAVQVRSRQAILDNLGVEVTNERYILAPELMIERKSNLVILDIDLKIDFAVTELFMKSKNCLSLPLGLSGVPWGRYVAGLTYFPYSNFSIYFLNLMKEYFSFALKHGPQWTLDQATFAVVVEYVRSKHINFQLHDTGIELYLKATRTTPMRLRGAKNRAKGSNLASMSEF